VFFFFFFKQEFFSSFSLLPISYLNVTTTTIYKENLFFQRSCKFILVRYIYFILFYFWEVFLLCSRVHTYLSAIWVYIIICLEFVSNEEASNSFLFEFFLWRMKGWRSKYLPLISIPCRPAQLLLETKRLWWWRGSFTLLPISLLLGPPMHFLDDKHRVLLLLWCFLLRQNFATTIIVSLLDDTPPSRWYTWARERWVVEGSKFGSFSRTLFFLRTIRYFRPDVYVAFRASSMREEKKTI
jgi:hypothetical protein